MVIYGGIPFAGFYFGGIYLYLNIISGNTQVGADVLPFCVHFYDSISFYIVVGGIGPPPWPSSPDAEASFWRMV